MTRMMNKDEAMAALQAAVITSNGDAEAAHGNADEALCAFLRWLGHGDLVEVWEKVDKWYA